MVNWKTELTFNGTFISSVDICRGIFQGDSLSPILFVLSMIPLSFLLKRENYGYKMNSAGVMLNHLFFMDDLKLYGRNEKELEGLLGIVEKFSRDIGMEFVFQKCASLKIVSGVRKSFSGITLSSEDTIKDLEEQG